MDNMLCDELLQEIFTRLPSTSSSSSLSVSLVSKRWLNLYRSSKTSLSLRLPPHNSVFISLSSLLSYYSSLSSLSLALSDSTSNSKNKPSIAFFDQLLLVVSSSCSNLQHLRFLPGPVSVSSLFSLSKTCSNLTSITVSLTRPLFLQWVVSFSCLKDLSLYLSSIDGVNDKVEELEFYSNKEFDEKFSLETLCLSGIQAEDKGLGWLWRNCKRLKKLQLKSCESLGDAESFSSFIFSFEGLQEVELRKCRSIINGVLLRLGQNCTSLNSLLLYDGGSREGLLEFLTTCKCNLQKLDLRLPLDLNNDHILAVAMNLRNCLTSLRLQSCCLVTGIGLKTLGTALHSTLEELALINCDVVEREKGLLATLGQNLRMLRKLDLSYNEMLVDKEFVSMLVSCNNLIELKLRGCRKLTGLILVSVSKTCRDLQCIDVVNCPGIEAQAVETFVLDCPKLRRMQVEDCKVSDTVRTWAFHKVIEVTAG